jgi:hypothetical protein
MHLIKALRRVIGLDLSLQLKNSGNIKNLLRSVDENVAVTFADVYYEKRAREKEVFLKGINFGHTFKNKNSFYRIELSLNVLFFVGTEAEILDNIRAKIDALKAEEDKLKKPIMDV